jgi:glyoxylase-like metal-dependent hydrolase (beta-lactamase superfamily II)
MRGVPPSDVEPLLPGPLRLGRAELQVLEPPGHTTDNVGLVVDGRALLAGDSLFEHAVARPDLERGAEAASLAARDLYATIHERILPLGDDVRLLPAHYPGGRRSGPVAPTLGDVRRGQWLLSLDADAFVEQVVGAMPELAVSLASGLEHGGNACAAG